MFSKSFNVKLKHAIQVDLDGKCLRIWVGSEDPLGGMEGKILMIPIKKLTDDYLKECSNEYDIEAMYGLKIILTDVVSKLDNLMKGA